MRLIGTLDNEKDALIFSQFLNQQKIPHQIEIKREEDWANFSYGSSHYRIWIYEENHIEEVLKWFQLFTEDPQNLLFTSNSFAPQPQEVPSTPLKPTSQSARTLSHWEQQPMGLITRLILFVCCFLFILSQLWVPSIKVPPQYAGLILFSSPVEKALLFDYPKFYELLERFFQLYGYEELEHSTENLSPEGRVLLQRINQTPFWQGFYPLILKGGWDEIKQGFEKYPTFEKIRKGEVWRLFTPCLLHADLFHIFFNMLWLIVLGKQIEQRLKPFRYILFMLIAGILSNTGQYLTSGANFIGFSGILCTMLAFIWMRQKFAAWEGYQLDRLSLLFILIFILSMAGIQVVSFFLEKSFALNFSPNIANTAHLIGGGVGFLFGKLNYFRYDRT